MAKELPKPVSVKSSKRALWAEIQAMQEEIDSQQAEILRWREVAEKAKKERDVAAGQRDYAGHQLSVIAAVLAPNLAARKP